MEVVYVRISFSLHNFLVEDLNHHRYGHIWREGGGANIYTRTYPIRLGQGRGQGPSPAAKHVQLQAVKRR